MNITLNPKFEERIYMRNKLLLTVFSVIAILAIAVSPVHAITGNYVEDFERPYVGLVAFYDAEGEFIWRSAALCFRRLYS